MYLSNQTPLSSHCPSELREILCLVSGVLPCLCSGERMEKEMRCMGLFWTFYQYLTKWLSFFKFWLLRVLVPIITCPGVHNRLILLDPNFLFRQHSLRASSEQVNNMHFSEVICRHKYICVLPDYQKDKITKTTVMLFSNFKTKHLCTQTETPAVS